MKRFFSDFFPNGKFSKEFSAIKQKNQVDSLALLRCLSSTGRIGWREDQRSLVNTLENFIDEGHVRLFAFLCLVLDEKQEVSKHVSELWEPINSIFKILHKRDGFSSSGTLDEKPKMWLQPGIPCLLDALIQLISAEKTKYEIYNNRWGGLNPDCWKMSAEFAVKLVDFAVTDLAPNPLYAGVHLDEIAKVVKNRAAPLLHLSEDDAKKLPNYFRVRGDPEGSYSPQPGHAPVLMAAASKEVNFVKEVRTLSQESGAIVVFKLFIGL